MQDSTQHHIAIDLWEPIAFHQAFEQNLKEFTFRFPMRGANHFYLAATSRTRIVGFIKAEETPNDYYLNYIEVSKRHQGNGYSCLLLRRLFDMAANTNRAILFSGFTTVGAQILVPCINTLGQKFPSIPLAYEQHA